MAKHETKEEFEEKVLHVNRCSKVVTGGRKFSFSALVIVGNGKGEIGFGFAKANELTDAIKKAGDSARKSVFRITMEGTTIPHEISLSWDGAHVMLKPAKEGTGVIAGAQTRAILELAGVHDVVAKCLGGKNPFNNLRATLGALKKLKSKEHIQKMRGRA